MLSRLRALTERQLGITVFRDSLPYGASLTRDCARLELSPGVIFDVGANVGQSACAFAASWPSATIYSFEPVARTFSQLMKATRTLPNVQRFQHALGDVDHTASMHISPLSAMSSIVVDSGTHVSERVRVRTLDGFCAERGILSIDLLKVDTEGNDMKVLEGAQEMLRTGSIKAVVAEVGFGVRKQRFVPFESISTYLASFGFQLTAFYDQTIRHQALERADAFFIRA